MPRANRIGCEPARIVQGIERGGELTLSKIENGKIEQQPHIVGREDEGLAVLRNGCGGVTSGNQELRGSVMRSGNLLDGHRDA